MKMKVSSLTKCPHCESRISLLKIRPQFRCPTCGGVINSNVAYVEIGTLILVAVVTILTPTERFSRLGEFAAYVAIAVVGIAIGYLFLRMKKASGSG